MAIEAEEEVSQSELVHDELYAFIHQVKELFYERHQRVK